MAPSPRLILLTQWFEPEPVVKGLAFARRLGERGFEVEVVTGFPNYPGGRVYDGYRLRPIRRERVEGVAVTRLALYPSHDRNRLGRVLNYVSFFLSATLYLLFVARRAQVIYAYHPPLTVGLAAAAARLFRGVPVVVDVQDMWPDTLRATGMIGNEAVLSLIGRVCGWMWRWADHIVVLSPGFRRLLVERGVAEDKITVIPNWADEAAVSAGGPPPPAAAAEPGRFRVLFAGNMGAAQGLDAVLDAAALLQTAHSGVEVCLLGSGVETDRLKARVATEGIGNVRFLPRVPKAEAGAWLAAADVLLVHLRDNPLFAITIPSKTQDYMAAGRPILMAVKGDAADLARLSGGGVAVPPEDPAALARAIVDLARKPTAELSALGVRARRYYEAHLSFDRGTDAFATVLRQTARRNGSTVGRD